MLEEAQILTLHDYLHELKDRHIPDGLHVIGRPYCESQVRDTAAATLGSRGWETVQSLLAAAAEHAAALQASPQAELDGVVNALAGGYLAPSSGSDVLRNPSAAPTGRNLYSISAEQTPSEEAWRVGQQMARAILAQHVVQEGRYPRRVAVTLWGGEFIRTRGATLAQILYLMGARPQRDARGTVYDVEIIPAEELGRPRIDVVVQTSGQFRDAAASRVRLIDQAVQRIADQQDEPYPNFVRENTQQAEEDLKQQGYAPREARQWATARVFGATGNASYGTGIMGLVERGDTWESEAEIAERYLANMSGVYRGDGVWGTPAPGLFQTQLAGAEIVVQPRSSNTWGPLSLDHVYGWNVMQPAVIGDAMWEETFQVYIEDKHGLDLQAYFEEVHPAALQDMTAIMLETIRKGLWEPSPATVQRLAELHAELVARHGAGCSYETCGNRSLHEFLTGVLEVPGAELVGEVLEGYQSQLAAALTSARPLPEVTGMELEERRDTWETAAAPVQPLATALLAAWIVAATALIVLAGLARPAKFAV